MKAGKQDKENKIELPGKVVEKKISEGSKNEHDAICLETAKGLFVLRRLGGHAFADPELKKLVGKKIIAIGIIHNYLFLASDIKTTK